MRRLLTRSSGVVRSSRASQLRRWASSKPSTESSGASVVDYLGYAVFGSVVVATGCLGVWQTKRFFWKVGLIESRERQLAEPAVPLQQLLDAVAEGRFEAEEGGIADAVGNRRVFLSGSYDYGGEMYVGPRPKPRGVKGQPGGATRRSTTDRIGYLVVTPLVRPDGSRVLVMRGWAPRWAVEAADGDEAAAAVMNRVPGSVVVAGAVRDGETGITAAETSTDQRSSLGALHLPTLAAWADAPALLGDRPVLVEMLEVEEGSEAATASVVVDPARGTRRVMPLPSAEAQGSVGNLRPASSLINFATMPPVHAVYAITWFSLAIAGTFMTRRLLMRPRAGTVARHEMRGSPGARPSGNSVDK